MARGLRWENPPKDLTHIQGPLHIGRDRVRRRKLTKGWKTSLRNTRKILPAPRANNIRPYLDYSIEVLRFLADAGWEEAKRELHVRAGVSASLSDKDCTRT